MIENIKTLYKQLDRGNKAPSITAIADKCGVTYLTVKNYWLCDSGGWSVPEQHQKDVVEIFQEAIKEQNRIKNIEVKEPKKA